MILIDVFNSETMMAKIGRRIQNLTFYLIVFSDETTFQLNGIVNRYNCRLWLHINPYWMWEYIYNNTYAIYMGIHIQ